MTNKERAALDILICLTLGFSFVVCGCGKEAPVPAEQENVTQLEGTWVGSEMGGRAGEWTVVVSENHVEVNGPDGESYKGIFTLDSAAGPKRVDILLKDCSQQEYVGKTALGIYRLDGDKLTLASNEPGAAIRPEPASLQTGQDARVWTLTKQ
jgi:uncharacterized protein (TIGR03067 family)